MTWVEGVVEIFDTIGVFNDNDVVVVWEQLIEWGWTGWGEVLLLTGATVGSAVWVPTCTWRGEVPFSQVFGRDWEIEFNVDAAETAAAAAETAALAAAIAPGFGVGGLLFVLTVPTLLLELLLLLGTWESASDCKDELELLWLDVFIVGVVEVVTFPWSWITCKKEYKNS